MVGVKGTAGRMWGKREKEEKMTRKKKKQQGTNKRMKERGMNKKSPNLKKRRVIFRFVLNGTGKKERKKGYKRSEPTIG